MPITPERIIRPAGFMAASNKARWRVTIDRATFDNPINGLRYDNEREGKYSRLRSVANWIFFVKKFCGHAC